MLKSDTEFVFIGVNEGIGKNSQKPYKFVKLANPLTFQNFTLAGDLTKTFVNFKQGERVGLKVDLVENFGNTSLLVTDIFPYTK